MDSEKVALITEIIESGSRAISGEGDVVSLDIDHKFWNLGQLDLGFKTITFTADLSFIYADGVAFMNCYNDHWTAQSVFVDTMELGFSPKYWSPSI